MQPSPAASSIPEIGGSALTSPPCETRLDGLAGGGRSARSASTKNVAWSSEPITIIRLPNCSIPRSTHELSRICLSHKCAISSMVLEQLVPYQTTGLHILVCSC